MQWQSWLRDDSLSWLLEPETPGVRYLALRDLLDRPPSDSELLTARRAAHQLGPIATALDAMEPEGYWVKPGAGYSPKYRSTVWSVMLLAQLGASPQEDARVAAACEYLLEHTLTPTGQFGANGRPSDTFDCLQGNLAWSLLELGCDPVRLEAAYDWIARSVTGEQIASADETDAAVRYYGQKCGPGFMCGNNDGEACAWGCIKVLLALTRWPPKRNTPMLERARRRAIELLLSIDPATADYPRRAGSNIHRAWWRFGFPLDYRADLLQLVEALALAIHGTDPRLANALDLILSKQDADGRWPLAYGQAGKVWGDYGAKGQPNKWVTLRALRTLKAVAT